MSAQPEEPPAPDPEPLELVTCEAQDRPHYRRRFCVNPKPVENDYE